MEVIGQNAQLDALSGHPDRIAVHGFGMSDRSLSRSTLPPPVSLAAFADGGFDADMIDVPSNVWREPSGDWPKSSIIPIHCARRTASLFPCRPSNVRFDVHDMPFARIYGN
jgi:hypothetical protein